MAQFLLRIVYHMYGSESDTASISPSVEGTGHDLTGSRLDIHIHHIPIQIGRTDLIRRTDNKFSTNNTMLLTIQNEVF